MEKEIFRWVHDMFGYWAYDFFFFFSLNPKWHRLLVQLGRTFAKTIIEIRQKEYSSTLHLFVFIKKKKNLIYSKKRHYEIFRIKKKKKKKKNFMKSTNVNK